MIRVCKPGGYILLLQRGSSYLSPYNSWLKFKAARDIMQTGSVEHLDFEEILDRNFKGLDIVHKERRNLGMTYVYIYQKPF